MKRFAIPYVFNFSYFGKIKNFDFAVMFFGIWFFCLLGHRRRTLSIEIGRKIFWIRKDKIK